MARLIHRGLAPTVLSAGLLLLSAQANAEITLIDGINQPQAPIKNLKIQIGGGLRPSYRALSDGSDHGSFQRRGYDNGSRLRLTMEYQLKPKLSLLGYYEMGFDIFNTLHWKNHYDPHNNNTYTRQLYAGVKSDDYGTLTFGKQENVYYDIVGAKTDLWNNDMHGQGPGNGIDGDHDGSFRADDLLKYQRVFNRLSFMASLSTPTSSFSLPNADKTPFRYKRKFGGAVGADYALTPDLTLSAAYSYTRARLNEQGLTGKTYNQQLAGAAISWKPGPWILAVGGGFYKNFVPCHDLHIVPINYFEGSAHGWEYFAGYTFNIDNSVIKGIQPYFAGDGMRWQHYQTSHQYLGLSTRFAHNFRVDIEHTFSNTSDKQPDENWINVYYDF